ncbi:MAG: succinate dehydrogenase/fumarate reductase iron-sulfur subunit [Desulfobacterales bacterium]|nr:MAG: succinate dehydrogenase/fumarate reductase iron-sulfur subunit [Desulfobacterales bacterium]
MTMQTVTFRIWRFKAAQIDPPQFQDFKLSVEANMSVLEGLEKIRQEQDQTLMYRHSCHHASCGTCACKINGRERLACITPIKDLPARPITLTPLDGFASLGDLVVDMHRFYKNLSADWSYLRESDHPGPSRAPREVKPFMRFENCVECGACVSACPVTPESEKFMGPAALAALHDELEKSPAKAADLLSLAGGSRGVRWCKSALRCSQVCPTAVYPARHIAELRRRGERSTK